MGTAHRLCQVGPRGLQRGRNANRPEPFGEDRLEGRLSFGGALKQ